LNLNDLFTRTTAGIITLGTPEVHSDVFSIFYDIKMFESKKNLKTIINKQIILNSLIIDIFEGWDGGDKNISFSY